MDSSFRLGVRIGFKDIGFEISGHIYFHPPGDRHTSVSKPGEKDRVLPSDGYHRAPRCCHSLSRRELFVAGNGRRRKGGGPMASGRTDCGYCIEIPHPRVVRVVTRHRVSLPSPQTPRSHPFPPGCFGMGSHSCRFALHRQQPNRSDGFLGRRTPCTFRWLLSRYEARFHSSCLSCGDDAYPRSDPQKVATGASWGIWQME